MEQLKKRYLSLDVFRGLDIALMIIVNSPGKQATTFAPLLHAKWHGFTLTDLVFPTFLFIVGNSMSFSMPKYEALSNNTFLKKVLKRTVIIFLLGYLMYWFPFFENGGLKPLSDTRVFGVLQRIALCYFFAALILRFWKTKGALVFSAIALISYQLLLHSFGDLSLAGNAVLKLDTWLIGESHMYHGDGIAFDPEGLLSTLPAIVNIIAGYTAGKFLQKSGQNYKTIVRMIILGGLLILTALAWDTIFPFNKKLWTSSFVLLTIGLDLIILSVLVYVLDIAKKIKWTYFFEILGKNPLFIYLLSELLVITLYQIKIKGDSAYDWIAENIFASHLGGYLGSLGFALSIMLSCWIVGYFLNKNKIYIKI
jgi:predicted acyltransferase